MECNGKELSLRLDGHDDEESTIKSLQEAMADIRVKSLECRYFTWNEQITTVINALLQCDDRDWNELTIQSCSGQLSPNLARMHRLRCLTLSMVPITEPLHLNPHLEELSLFEVSLPEYVTRSLGESLARSSIRIKKLDLTDSRFIENASAILALALRENVTLDTLCISECNLMDEQIEEIVWALERHPAIRDLDISFNKCRSSGVLALTRLIRSETCKLTNLSMDFQAFGEGKRIDVAPILAALSSTNNCPLRELGLGGNSLRDGDMSDLVNTLCTNQTISKLDLSENRFSDHGIQILAEGLPEMKGLRHVILDDNRFGPIGLEAVANALEKNTGIVEIEVSQNLKNSDAWSRVLYFLDTNWGGRHILQEEHPVPLGLWPLLMGRASQRKPEWMSRTPSAQDIIYCLVRGPAILHR